MGCTLACAAAAAPAPELEQATVKGGVSIQLPKGWKANPGGGSSGLTAAAATADSDTTGKFQASLSIDQNAGNKIDGTAVLAFLSQKIPGFRAVEQPTAVAVNGMQGVYFGGTFKSGNVELRTPAIHVHRQQPGPHDNLHRPQFPVGRLQAAPGSQRGHVHPEKIATGRPPPVSSAAGAAAARRGTGSDNRIGAVADHPAKGRHRAEFLV